MLLLLPKVLQQHAVHKEHTYCSCASAALLDKLFTFCSVPRPAPSSLGNQGTTFLTQGAPAVGQL